MSDSTKKEMYERFPDFYESWDKYYDQVKGYRDMSDSQMCDHEWELYAGLTETFEYCIKCDKIKR